MLRETYSKHGINRLSSKIPEVSTIGHAMMKNLLKIKDNAIHDKKVEICELREKVEDLRLVINMMVRGINQMEVIQ